MYTKWYSVILSLSGVKYFSNDSSVFPSTISRREEFIHKISILKRKNLKIFFFLPVPRPRFTDVYEPAALWKPCLASCEQWPSLMQSTGKGGYYFSWERSRALGWDWLIQTRWVATHRCDKNRNTLQTFQAWSSRGQEVGCGLCLLPYLPPNVLSNQRMLMIRTLLLYVSSLVMWHWTCSAILKVTWPWSRFPYKSSPKKAFHLVPKYIIWKSSSTWKVACQKLLLTVTSQERRACV